MPYIEDMSTNEVTNEVPTVSLAVSTSFTSDTVHVAKRVNGRTFTACNGRSAFGNGTGLASEVTCKRCRKSVTL